VEKIIASDKLNLVSSMGIGRPGFDSRIVKVTLSVIDHEMLSTIIRTVPLLWHVQKLSVACEVKAPSTTKLLDSLPNNDAVAEVCSCVFKVAFCRDLEYKQRPSPTPINLI
jgi:hypothetical protein